MDKGMAKTAEQTIINLESRIADLHYAMRLLVEVLEQHSHSITDPEARQEMWTAIREASIVSRGVVLPRVMADDDGDICEANDPILEDEGL